MSNAFAPICGLDLAPSLADLFIVGVAPIDYSPILLLRLFGFRIAPDTLSSTGLRRWPARHYPCLWIQRPSSERWRDFNPPDSCATQHTLWTHPTPHLARSGPHGPPVGLSPETSRWGLPCCLSSRCVRAVATTPVELLGAYRSLP